MTKFDGTKFGILIINTKSAHLTVMDSPIVRIVISEKNIVLDHKFYYSYKIVAHKGLMAILAIV